MRTSHFGEISSQLCAHCLIETLDFAVHSGILLSSPFPWVVVMRNRLNSWSRTESWWAIIYLWRFSTIFLFFFSETFCVGRGSSQKCKVYLEWFIQPISISFTAASTIAIFEHSIYLNHKAMNRKKRDLQSMKRMELAGQCKSKHSRRKFGAETDASWLVLLYSVQSLDEVWYQLSTIHWSKPSIDVPMNLNVLVNNENPTVRIVGLKYDGFLLRGK